MNQKIVWNRK